MGNLLRLYALVILVAMCVGCGGGGSSTPPSGNSNPTAVLAANPSSGVAPLSVAFNAASSSDSDGIIVKYRWDWTGDGSWDLDSGAVATANYTYADPGVFTAIVQVTDDDGATATAFATVTVNGPGGMDVGINATPLTGDAPLTVLFNVTLNSGTANQFEWDWEGDGTFDETGATGENVEHLFTTPSTYNVTVRVTDELGGTHVGYVTITVTSSDNDLPVASLVANPTSGPAPLSVDFDASGSRDPDGTIADYEWDIDGVVNGWNWVPGITGSTFNHTYASPGTFKPTVRVTDNDGATAMRSVTVTVAAPPNQAPSAVVTASPSTGNAPLEVYLDGSGSTDPDGNIVKYEWDWEGDGTWDISGATNAQVKTYSVVGTFNASLRVTDNEGLTDTTSVTITVNAGGGGNQVPTANLSVSPSAGTAPLTVSFDAGGSNDPDGTIVEYKFFFGNGQTQTTTSPTAQYTFDIPGNYDVAVQVTDNDGANGTAFKSVLVNELPNTPPNATMSATPSSGSAPLIVNFNASGSTDSDGTIVKYEWDWDGTGNGPWDANTGATPTMGHTYPVAGNFQGLCPCNG